jgi:hypothetical protein
LDGDFDEALHDPCLWVDGFEVDAAAPVTPSKAGLEVGELFVEEGGELLFIMFVFVCVLGWGGECEGSVYVCSGG